jgi:uncharacterized protein YggE
MAPETTPQASSPQKPNQKLNLQLDLRWVVLALLAVIVLLVLLWRPWDVTTSADARTIEVTGEAKVSAEPDEYVFSPNYTFKNDSKETALKELTAKSEAVTAGLKALGLPDSAIKSDSSGYNGGVYYYDETNRDYVYTLGFTVKVTDEKQVQKIQDYLVTTSPTGSVSPAATFSTEKRKELESQARDEATLEARAKADQSAKNLGFKVVKVKTITDGSLGGIYPYATHSMAAEDSVKSSAPELTVQPGENELNYVVTVVYYIR